MRRILGMATVLLLIVTLVAACGGKKDAGAVVKDLDNRVAKMKSYTSTGTMTLNTGLQPQKYDVEVWFKQDSYYRIALSDPKKNISQIVLRNDEGVFVLTPHLNKSFRFQSEWPKNQGQVYLFQSLVESISSDPERSFTTDGDAYVFDVTANYHNASLVRQKIWLDQKSYAPKHVEVSDANGTVLVAMDFNEFKFDVDFDKDSFDMQRNMTSGLMTLPTMGAAEEASATEGAEPASTEQAEPASEELLVIEPGYVPEGVELAQVSETETGGEKKMLLKYSGSFNYTLLEYRPNDKPVSLAQGNVVDLGYAYGVIYGEEVKTLVWIHNGTEFRLTSGDLPQEEMVSIALSLEDQSAK